MVAIKGRKRGEKGRRRKIEKLKYNVGYQKIGNDFFIGGAYQSRT